MSLGILSIVLFNLVDTWFVARLGGGALAAMGFTLPVVMVMGSLAMGLGVGTTSALARAIGGGDSEGVRRLATDAIALAVGIVAVAARLQIFALIPAIALSTAMTPFVGQNWGAGERERVARAVRLSGLGTLVWGGVIWGLLALFAGPIARQFSPEPGVHMALVDFLVWVPLGYGLLGAYQVMSAAFNAVGQPMIAAGLSLGRAPLLVGLASVGAVVAGLPGLFVGMAVANAVIGVVALVLASWRLSVPDVALEPVLTK